MNTRKLLWLAPLPLFACYSPHDDVTTGGDDAPGESSSEGSSGGSLSTTAATLTTSEASTSSSTTPGSTDPASSDDTAAETADSTGTGGDPFCGDGAVDDDEECDAGEANAFEAECRPDCTFNTCGDGYVWEGVEGCDDGEDDNVLEVGACAPDCSRVIEEKVIRLGSPLPSGDLGNNPVAFADSTCLPGYAAMFAFSGVREATTSPLGTTGAIDWVLHPYTAYVDVEGTLVWITDDVPLLGVRDGAQQDLLASPTPWCGGLCLAFRIVANLDPDWTTAATENCSQWTSSNAAMTAKVGNPYLTDDFLDNGENLPCDDLNVFTDFYCVEQ